MPFLVERSVTLLYTRRVEFKAQGLASGVYFYKIHAGEFVSVKKLLLMK
jgi:hypothetical protein